MGGQGRLLGIVGRWWESGIEGSEIGVWRVLCRTIESAFPTFVQAIRAPVDPRRLPNIVRAGGARSEGESSGERGDGRRSRSGTRLGRMSWLTFLVGQGLLAMAWWWVSPGGFGPRHPRFWSNRVAPPLILVAVVVTLVALRRARRDALRLLLAGWPAAWAGMAMALRLLFPVTMARLWLVPAGVAVAMGMLAIRPWRRGSIDGRWICGLLADRRRRRDGRCGPRRGLAPASCRDPSPRHADGGGRAIGCDAGPRDAGEHPARWRGHAPDVRRFDLRLASSGLPSRSSRC